eukprot:GHVP01053034.1.p1 GENE.GHVP01053034.1~~GHVP01053034.1.p1  ORF type:complete len:279 (-),score=48.06 GHVP01053034.1:979-1815(-)
MKAGILIGELEPDTIKLTQKESVQTLELTDNFLYCNNVPKEMVYVISEENNDILKKENFDGNRCIICYNYREEGEKEVEELIKICNCPFEYYLSITDSYGLVIRHPFCNFNGPSICRKSFEYKDSDAFINFMTSVDAAIEICEKKYLELGFRDPFILRKGGLLKSDRIKATLSDILGFNCRSILKVKIIELTELKLECVEELMTSEEIRKGLDAIFEGNTRIEVSKECNLVINRREILQYLPQIRFLDVLKLKMYGNIRKTDANQLEKVNMEKVGTLY